VREDLIYAFEKAVATGLDEPMRQAVVDFLIRVRSGLAIDLALDHLQKSFDHEHFRDLVAAIRFNFHYRGDLSAMLELLEIQMHRIEEEYARRRISNARDLTLTILILVLIPVFTVARLLMQPLTAGRFLNHPLGLMLMILGISAYLLAIISVLCIQHRISG